LLDENTICELILIVLWFIPLTLFFIVICILVCDACKSNINNNNNNNNNNGGGGDGQIPQFDDDDNNDHEIIDVDDDGNIMDENGDVIDNINNGNNNNNNIIVDQEDKNNIDQLNEIVNENEDIKIAEDPEMRKKIEDYNKALDEEEKKFQKYSKMKEDEGRKKALRMKLDDIKSEYSIPQYRTLEDIVNDQKLPVDVRKTILTLTKDILAINKQLEIANTFDIYLGNLKFENLGNIDIK
jgi:hypothetical protein